MVGGHMAPDVKLSQWKTRAGGDWQRGLLRSPGSWQDACGTGDLPGGGGVGVGGLPSHPATGRWEERSVFEGQNGTQGMKTVLTACGPAHAFLPHCLSFPPPCFLVWKLRIKASVVLYHLLKSQHSAVEGP